MFKKQLAKFYTKISRDIGEYTKDDNLLNDAKDLVIEYELRFGQKSAGKFVPVFNEVIKQKVFNILGIDTSSLITEESINSYYDNNLRKVSTKCDSQQTGHSIYDSQQTSIFKDTIECKETIKRIDWYMDNGLCLRFALSNEKTFPDEERILSDLSTTQPLVVRKKVRQIYKDPQSNTEYHFTTIETTNKEGIKVSHEMEIEYKKIKDINIVILDKILNCFN